MVQRKIGNVYTTISVSWVDKEEFRKFAKFVRKTKTGDVFESDSILFKRMLELFKSSNKVESEEPRKTYPRKISSQEHGQQG